MRHNNDTNRMARPPIDPPAGKSHTYDGLSFKDQIRERADQVNNEVTIAHPVPVVDAVAITGSHHLHGETQDQLLQQENQLRIDLLEQQVIDLRHRTNQGDDSSSSVCSPKLKKLIFYTVGALILLGGAVVAGLCGSGMCRRSHTPSMVMGMMIPVRAQFILDYINAIRTGPALSYLDTTTPEGRAVHWLIDDDRMRTQPTEELALRQRYALTTLWFQPTVSGSSNLFGDANHWATWATNISECDWLGVKCNNNDGVVTELDLDNTNVVGRLPPDLGLLNQIQTLSLSDNALIGTIPSSIGRLTGLQQLWLRGNKLTGRIPLSFGNLTSLIGLGLDTNQLMGTIPSSLGNLTSLTGLWLYSNDLTGMIPSSLGFLTSLIDLSLSNNELTGTIPSSMMALTALKNLYLLGNKLTGTIPRCGLNQAVADCNEVICTCCTQCCPTGGWGDIPGYEYCDAR